MQQREHCSCKGYKLKLRQGFVTNSSSTSYVVAFNHTPTCVDDFKAMINIDESEKYDEAEIQALYTNISDLVFKQLHGQQPQTLKSLNRNFPFITRKGCPNKYFDYRNKKQINLYYKQCRNFRKSIIKKFIKNNEGKFIFIFRFSSDMGSELEALLRGYAGDMVFKGLDFFTESE